MEEAFEAARARKARRVAEAVDQTAVADIMNKPEDKAADKSDNKFDKLSVNKLVNKIDKSSANKSDNADNIF